MYWRPFSQGQQRYNHTFLPVGDGWTGYTGWVRVIALQCKHSNTQGKSPRTLHSLCSMWIWQYCMIQLCKTLPHKCVPSSLRESIPFLKKNVRRLNKGSLDGLTEKKPTGDSIPVTVRAIEPDSVPGKLERLLLLDFLGVPQIRTQILHKAVQF